MLIPPDYAPKLTRAQRVRREAALISLWKFQYPVFWCEHGLLLLHWSRQIGKSFVLAAWAVNRLLTHHGRLVTVLSNSKANGAEFIHKCAEICGLVRVAFERLDLSPDDRIENMRMEIRVTAQGKVGRIIVLAANPRTARGFSGDLILDEFAFHEDSDAIWDAAEPIISSNSSYLCRIASTGNGRFNRFYRMVTQPSLHTISRVRRSDAYPMGLKIYDPNSRLEITPAQARAAAQDKLSYDQNYECAFNDENMALLTHSLITSCEYPGSANLRGAAGDQRGSEGGRASIGIIANGSECQICTQDWSRDSLAFLTSCNGPLGVGLDIGRSRDITVITIGEKISGILFTRAILRVHSMRLPQQLDLLRPILNLPNFGRLSGDSTGIGLGLIEFAQEERGPYRVEAVHFASREKRIINGIRQTDSALLTELMALDLLEAFENRAIRIPCEIALRESLRKPERITSANGVRIAATRDESGHADEFWSLALMVRALKGPASEPAFDVSEEIPGGKSTLIERKPLLWP